MFEDIKKLGPQKVGGVTLHNANNENSKQLDFTEAYLEGSLKTVAFYLSPQALSDVLKVLCCQGVLRS